MSQSNGISQGVASLEAFEDSAPKEETKGYKIGTSGGQDWMVRGATRVSGLLNVTTYVVRNR